MGLSKRRLVLHIGTPKTGTTRLQILMGRQTASLAARGILIPNAGRGAEKHMGAHQALAHALMSDAVASEDDLAALIAELDASPVPLAIVSSENFCWLYFFPEALQNVRDALASIGYESTILMYAREQAGFAESVYAEFVKQGFAWDPDSYVRAVLDRGPLGDTKTWRFCFDYVALADRFAETFGVENVIVRPFHASAPAADLLHDFSRASGMKSDGSAFVPDGTLHNPRLTFSSLLGRLRENASRKPAEAPTVSELLLDLGFREDAFAEKAFSFLDDGDVGRIRASYASINARLATRYGVTIPLEHARASQFTTPEMRVLRAASARWNLERI